MAEITTPGGAPLTWQMVVLLAGKAEEAEGEGLTPKIAEVKAKELEEGKPPEGE